MVRQVKLDCGKRIPEHALAQYVLQPPETIDMSQSELARLAFQALLSDVHRKTPNPEGSAYVLKTTFVPRESTAMNGGKRGAATTAGLEAGRKLCLLLRHNSQIPGL